MRESMVITAAFVLLLIFLALAIYALASFGSQLASILGSINISGITFPQFNLSGVNTTNVTLPGKPPATQMTEDAQRYYELKNTSCATLAGNFLIVTEDVSQGTFYGIVPDTEEERAAAGSLLAPFGFNQTTKTYLRGERMKRVIINENGNTTTIWKDGRVYNCTPNCTMRVFTEQDSEEYYAMLSSMKSGCAYFGRTQMPSYVDMGRLIQIERTEPRDIGSFRCQEFLISGNKTYAESLLSSASLSEDQEALLWGIAHLRGPVEECLDEATGIIVLRKLTLDLTNTYKFDYSPGGYMKVDQQTELTYFSTNVPESFLALPS
ncbi:MAG: hypothetical protein PHF60_00955 [Candidatus ainarchaeum sp.]|nr:hypothetical protein [Candidatus ainarchaeum sp.]